MKYSIKQITKWAAIAAISVIGLSTFNANSVMAEGYGLTVAPMNEKIIIDPNDSYDSSFRISNPSASTQDTYYKVEVAPYYVNEKGEKTHDIEGEHNEIVKWVTFNTPTEGKLEPNETKEVSFTVEVPKSAPAGGQYMSILVTASGKPIDDDNNSSSADDNSNAAIKEIKKMSHVVYAEITGNTTKKGVISDMALPSFLLSGNITGSATVKNEGNVHGDAKYTLQIYPLFSGEEVYTNEDKPTTATILPNRELFKEVTWENTPSMGIFNAVFTVEFEGQTQQISRMIIICPIWLLFLIIFIIFAIIIWIVLRVKNRSKKSRRASTNPAE